MKKLNAKALADPDSIVPGIEFTQHDLRRTFITVAESLDIPYAALKKLLNHSDGSDVTGGYLQITTDRLRGPMERISIGNYKGEMIPATRSVSPQRKRIISKKRELSRAPGSRQFEYQFQSTSSSNDIKELPTVSNFADVAEETFAELVSPPNSLNRDSTPLQSGNSYYGKFVYRLDYKSVNKRSLDLKDCKASMIEKLAVGKGCGKASRNGHFYKSYWWFNPGLDAVNLAGLLMPAYTPDSSVTVYDQADQAILDLTTTAQNKLTINEVKADSVFPA